MVSETGKTAVHNINMEPSVLHVHVVAEFKKYTVSYLPRSRTVVSAILGALSKPDSPVVGHPPNITTSTT